MESLMHNRGSNDDNEGVVRTEMNSLAGLEWLKSVSWDSMNRSLLNVSDSATCVRVINDSNDNDECVMESLSTLLIARSLMKNRASSEEAWRALEGLMLTQGSNGFFPKFAYFQSLNSTSTGSTTGRTGTRDNTGNSNNDGWYLPSNLFDNLEVPAVYLPEKALVVNHHKKNDHARGDGDFVWMLKTSGRISAVPFHASFVLDTFYLSAQEQADVKRLSNLFCRLYRWHTFIHNVLLPIHCLNPASSCFNIIHPWETIFPFHPQLIDLNFWSQALQIDSSSPSYQSIHQKLHSLFDCQQKNKLNNDKSTHSLFSSTFSTMEAKTATGTSSNMNPLGVKESKMYERKILKSCQHWAMMDITYAAALAQSNQDMQQILNILSAKNAPILRNINFSDINATVTKWIQQSRKILQSAYHSKQQTFLNTVSNKNTNKTSSSISQPVAFNFMGAWPKETELESKFNQQVTDMSFLIFENKGNFSFNCNEFPLSLRGNCSNQLPSSQHHSILSPTLNYMLSIGFQDNDFHGISPYLQTSTLHSICRLPQNSIDYNLTEYCIASFLQSQNSLPKTSPIPFFPPYLSSEPLSSQSSLSTSVINVTSASTAAVLYNILIPDPPFFQYQANPPIRNEVVLAIIAIELVLAFGIGLSCLLLNFNLMRRLKKEDEQDTFVQRLHDRRTLLSQIYGRVAEGDPSTIVDDEDEDEDVDPADMIEQNNTQRLQQQQQQQQQQHNFPFTNNNNNNNNQNQPDSHLDSNASTAGTKTKNWSSTYASVSNYVTSSSLWQRFSLSSENNKEMTNNIT